MQPCTFCGGNPLLPPAPFCCVGASLRMTVSEAEEKAYVRASAELFGSLYTMAEMEYEAAHDRLCEKYYREWAEAGLVEEQP